MPLVIVSGYPCAGKTHRTRQLVEYCKGQIANSKSIIESPTSDQNAPLSPAQIRHHGQVANLKVHVVDDDDLGISRDVYGVVRHEKDARAAAISAVKRFLQPDTIVIADGMNYIKGYRYQMYCEAKAVATPSCVLHIGSSPEQCRERNQARIDSVDGAERKLAYPPAVLDNLIFRFEEPNGMTRWDSPLFVAISEDESPDNKGIWSSIVGTVDEASKTGTNMKAVKPNLATVLSVTTPQDALQALHSQTSVVLAAIQSFQADRADVGRGAGELVSVPGCDEAVELPGWPLMPAQLQRLRREYVQMRRKGGLVLGGGHKDGSVGQVGGPDGNGMGYTASFVGYLNREFQGERRSFD